MDSFKKYFVIHPAVVTALADKQPVLALESTIIAHGMPYPQNYEFAKRAEATCRAYGATPATIAIIDGKIRVGLDDNQLKLLSNNDSVEKIALRDIAYALQKNIIGATTVSATMHLAHLCGIKVFATGGIGGVHRNANQTFDISQDLLALSNIPLIVVSAGVKAILDIPKTLEYLETVAVPIVGYRTNDFPAFYSRTSGNLLTQRCDDPKEIAQLYRINTDLKLKSVLLVANPIPQSAEIQSGIINKYINEALVDCDQHKITGKAITPYLLKRIVELSNGTSLAANIALALNNVRLGAQIAGALTVL